MTVFNLVPQSDKEFEILAFWRAIATEVLFDALGQIPVLWVAIDANVPVALGSLPRLLVPRVPSFLEIDRVKQRGPGDHDQHNVMRSPKSRPRTIVDVHSCDGCGSRFLQVVSDLSR